MSLDLTVQPKQYQSLKLGLTSVVVLDEGENPQVVLDRVRKEMGVELREAIKEEVEIVYGKAVADYVVNQTGKETK